MYICVCVCVCKTVIRTWAVDCLVKYKILETKLNFNFGVLELPIAYFEYKIKEQHSVCFFTYVVRYVVESKP